MNRFPLPGLVQPLARAVAGRSTYGLCGGMARLAADYYEAGRPIPLAEKAPAWGTPLHSALFLRQLNTFGPAGRHVGTFAAWTLPSNAALERRTMAHWTVIRAAVRQGHLTLVGLVYERSLWRLWDNHQVLAYAAPEDDALCVYDPNEPMRDDVVLRAQVTPAGVHVNQFVGARHKRHVRGLFVLPVAGKGDV